MLSALRRPIGERGRRYRVTPNAIRWPGRKTAGRAVPFVRRPGDRGRGLVQCHRVDERDAPAKTAVIDGDERGGHVRSRVARRRNAQGRAGTVAASSASSSRPSAQVYVDNLAEKRLPRLKIAAGLLGIDITSGQCSRLV
jgi:hypothetical protein